MSIIRMERASWHDDDTRIIMDGIHNRPSVTPVVCVTNAGAYRHSKTMPLHRNCTPSSASTEHTGNIAATILHLAWFQNTTSWPSFVIATSSDLTKCVKWLCVGLLTAVATNTNTEKCQRQMAQKEKGLISRMNTCLKYRVNTICTITIADITFKNHNLFKPGRIKIV